MLTELQIETIIAETCGTYRTGGSYTFEDVWNCIEKALAAHNTGAQEPNKPVAWLHEITEPGDKRARILSDRPANPWSHWATSYRKECGYKATPLYAQPQPMAQTDAARDVKDAKRYRWLREPGNNCITFDRESFPTLCALDAALDAEIERGEREGEA